LTFASWFPDPDGTLSFPSLLVTVGSLILKFAQTVPKDFQSDQGKSRLYFSKWVTKESSISHKWEKLRTEAAEKVIGSGGPLIKIR
jgi:hypothetical protein